MSISGPVCAITIDTGRTRAAEHRHYAIGLAPAMPDAFYRLSKQTNYFSEGTT